VSTALAAGVRDELSRLLEPVAAAAGSDERVGMLLDLVGQGAAAGGDPQVRAALEHLADLARAIAAIDEAELQSWAGVERVLRAGRDAMQVAHDLEANAADPQLAARLEHLGAELVGQLTGLHLRRHHPRLFRVACLLTLADPSELLGVRDAIVVGDAEVRAAWTRDELHLDRIAPLVRDPWTTLREAYFPNRFATALDAHAGAGRLFALLGPAAGALGLAWTVDDVSLLGPVTVDPSAEPDLGDHRSAGESPGSTPLPPIDAAAWLARVQPRFALVVPALDDAGVPVAARLALAVLASSADQPAGVAGLTVTIAGDLAWTETRGRWRLALESDGQIPVFVIAQDGPRLSPSSSPLARATARLSVTRLPGPDSEPAFVFGSATGTRIELRGVGAESRLEVAASGCAASLSVRASSGRLVIAPGDGDGFLRSVLPADGCTAAFDAGFVLSSTRGFELIGGVGLEALVPAHVSLGPIGSVDNVRLGLGAADGGLRADVACGVTVHLGPVDVSLDGVGVRATTSFTEGNLGVADLDVGFRPPNALALAIDAGPVIGGGALAADPERGQYVGEVHLQFEGIAVRAIGLLTTGSTGFSLLVLVSADFPPVQLGLGFRLVGVGGLLGINRTVAVEALRAGLKTGALGAVLNPPDPKAGAGQLVSTLAGFFPPAPGRHVFAPTARIVWGSPTLITIDLCLALELPSPVRLVALGRMRAVLPDEREAIVRLQVDVLGVIDFDRREAAVDATLVDSRLAQFALTGDMALRMSWGAQPAFLLAVGGFHPRFAAPPGFPALERVAVALASGDNPKLRLEAYLALTSNTVQFGARVDVAARAGSFSIAGFLSFDALVTLEPLAFEVDIAAKLAVKMGGRTLLSVSLSLTLSGPRPWRARGRASFSILFFDVSFGFDVTIGDEGPAALPTPVDVAPLLLAAMTDPRAWSAQLPAGADAVTLRALDPGTAVLAHPLGTLQVRQRVAPLERTLERFGTGVPSGTKRFRITLATVGGVRTTITPLQDHFAPAQFTALNDDAKLSAPSFEEMVSGAALGTDGYATGPAVSVSVVYEQVLVTAPGIAEPKPQRLAMPADVFGALIATPPQRAAAFAVKDAT
jgi:hypothetical protein